MMVLGPFLGILFCYWLVIGMIVIVTWPVWTVVIVVIMTVIWMVWRRI